jgi:serine/threonine-protein kinase RsbW
MSNESVLKLEAVLPNVPRAIDFVSEMALKAGFSAQGLNEIQIAVDEACANVVHHAYGGMEHGDMEIACRQDGQRFIIHLRDWGKSFEPEEIGDPDVCAPLEDRTLGGLGLFLIRQYMDEVHFAFDLDQGNELTMAKKLPAQE